MVDNNTNTNKNKDNSAEIKEIGLSINKEAEDKSKTEIKEDNVYKVITGIFVDMKNVEYKFGDKIVLTEGQIKKFNSLNIIGTSLIKV